MSTHHPMSQKCGKRNRAGGTCGQWAMHGQSVCYLHGGRSPQALRKADERMRDLVDPGITRLGELLSKADSDAVTLNAIKYILDWAGFKAADKVEGTGDVTIRIVHEDQPIITIDAPYASLNGRADG